MPFGAMLKIATVRGLSECSLAAFFRPDARAKQ